MNVRIEQLQLLGVRILVKPDVVETLDIVTAGGLVTASGKTIGSKEGMNNTLESVDPPTGVVVAVGPDVKSLYVGDRIIFSPFSGKKLTFMMDDYLLMSEPEPVSRITD